MDHTALQSSATLSVILPNYNHGRFLPRAFEALLSQSRPADEIIVIDDGSTDDSRDIIARYAEKNASIRPLPNSKNIGVIPTLIRGLEAARCDYVNFAAADDMVMPGFFATGLAALAAYPDAGLFCGDMIAVDHNSGEILGQRPPVRPRLRGGYVSPKKFEALLRRNDNFINTGAALLRRDGTIRAGGFDTTLSTFADGYLVRKIALASGLCYAPQVCVRWNIFPDSVSRTTSTDLRRADTVLRAVEARMKTDAGFPVWYWPVFERRWRFSMCRLAVEREQPDRNVLTALAADNGFERKIINVILMAAGNRLGRFAMLGWLWWKFRPFTLSGLASTAIARR